LGLAIVTDIVESWGGTLTLAGADPGLRATIRLPAP
jgi:signal transduction histidine kinase